MKNVAFLPAKITLHAGDSVSWRNEDIFAHTATSPENGLDVDLKPGTEGVATFARAGTINYICRYHPNMRGQLVIEP